MHDDEAVDRYDLEIDQIGMEILGLQQPLARDLRFVITAMKITNDLERIADLATNVAERAIELNEEPQLKPFIDIPRMAQIAREMVKESLDALVRLDANAARAAIARDDGVDALMEQLFRELMSYMIEDPRTISRALRLMMVAKYIERIGDGATNICEMVVYLVEAKVIRHGGLHPSGQTQP